MKIPVIGRNMALSLLASKAKTVSGLQDSERAVMYNNDYNGE
jgi:hypothetical protein